ncbi:GntR family transcriptional regulator, partial [Nocardiopsis sp. LOL_012]|uniref:GntR family transcriptional regulator n=1 Tax=Nocardiopsis sp. LOL_012 TaxID=3345409 RepID=UPI003A84EEB9
LRPHIEAAFAAEQVTIDFAGFSSETLHGALQEPLDRVREGRTRPRSIRIRILVTDLSQPRGLPVRSDTGQDDPQARARMRRIMLRHTQGIEDLVSELQHLDLVPQATACTRVHPLVPMGKIYLINRTQAFFGFYPVTEHRVPLGQETARIHDLMGRDSLLFHHSAGPDPDSVGSQYLAQAHAWFDSLWNSIAWERPQ